MIPKGRPEAVTAAGSLVGLGMAMAKIAGMAAAAFAHGPDRVCCHGRRSILGATLFLARTSAPTRMVGYERHRESGRRDNPARDGRGRLQRQFRGDDSCKSATAAKNLGWAVRYYGNFANVQILGNAGIIHRLPERQEPVRCSNSTCTTAPRENAGHVDHFAVP